MNISLSHCGFFFILQEVYDWAGGTDEMPLFFTLHKESRPTCISYKERLEGPEVLSFVERVSIGTALIVKTFAKRRILLYHTG